MKSNNILDYKDALLEAAWEASMPWVAVNSLEIGDDSKYSILVLYSGDVSCGGFDEFKSVFTDCTGEICTFNIVETDTDTFYKNCIRLIDNREWVYGVS